MAGNDGMNLGTAKVHLTAVDDGLTKGIKKARKVVHEFKGTVDGASEAFDNLGSVGKMKIDSLSRRIRQMGMTNTDKLRDAILRNTSGPIQSQLLTEFDQKFKAMNAAALSRHNEYGKTVKELNAAMRGVPAQLTDIFVGLQAGQRPLTVLLQQGGQLKDMFGGVVPAAKALGTTFIGMISPATLLAAAIGGLGAAAYAGVKRDEELATAITVAGNAAGVTVSQLNAMVDSVGAATGSFSGAQDALAALAGNSKIASQNFELVAQAAVGMKDVTGTAIEDTIKVFAKLAEDPVKDSQALNEQYNYLTASIYDEIKALDDQGRHEDAAALAQATYAKAVKQRCDEVKSNLNELGRAWAWLGEVASSAWRKMSSITQAKPIQEQIDKLNTIIGQLNEGPEKERLKSRVEELKKQLATEKQLAETQRVNAAAQRAAISFSADEDKYLTSRQKKDAEHRKNIAKIRAEYESAKKFIDKNGNAAPLISEAQYRQRIAHENARYREALERGRKTRTPSWGSSLDATQMRAKISEVQDALRDARSGLTERLANLDAAYKTSGLSVADYYAQRKALVTEDMQLQVDALNKQNDIMRSEKVSGKYRIILNKDIAKNESKALKIRNEAAAKIAKLDAKEIQNTKERKAALDNYRRSLNDYLNDLKKSYEREEVYSAFGDRNSSYISGINSIKDKYDNERRSLENERTSALEIGTWKPEDEASYQAKLAAVSQELNTELDLYKQHYSTMEDYADDWSVGASKAFENYFYNGRKYAQETQNFFENMFSSMEESMVEFLSTGKAGFKDFATSIIKDLMRIYIRGAASGLLGLVRNAGGFAGLVGSAVSYMGGDGVGAAINLSPSAKGNVFRGKGISAYSGSIVSKPTLFPFAHGTGLMGEAGPEAILPLTRGSNGKLGIQAQGSGGNTVNVVVNVSSDGTGSTRTNSSQQNASMGNALGRLVGTAVQSEMMNQMRPGGILWKWRAGRV